MTRSAVSRGSVFSGIARSAVLGWRSLHALRGNLVEWLRGAFAFMRSYDRQKANPIFARSVRFWYPILHERSYYQRLDPVYLYQDAWCAGRIFKARPSKHVDVASSLHFVSLVGQYVPVTFVDLHNPRLAFPGVTYVQGDICRLPFADRSVRSLSCLCVLEHIGLGRYGDTIDAFGSEAAARELSRVLAPGGRLFVSVPVDTENRIYHNAHRAFTRAYVVESLFPELSLTNEQYVYGAAMGGEYEPEKGFGTGLFEFTRL